MPRTFRHEGPQRPLCRCVPSVSGTRRHCLLTCPHTLCVLALHERNTATFCCKKEFCVCEHPLHVSRECGKQSRKCFWFSFVCSVLTCLVGQEQIYFSSDWQQRYCPVFSGLLWFFYISQVVSLTLHLPLFLVLGQSCLAFHHVRLQS